MSEMDPCHEERTSAASVEENTVAVLRNIGYDNAEQDFDTGIKAWLQVLGSFFFYFNSWYEYLI